ncbi:hypothetical protein SERLA73DRAFT_189576 [Serpula lacrymans var. lacrymans S7.3]|uniref:Uncharacterized protein n=2 Tax=Serpula lacrymans var. lacrymans TaxID=341189 RepID=F8QDY9_SERL3|nr:uncharacterized protein SERLADRAFT_480434 [Serpula lacrymans var. lacrymans S7.9]EGN93364.1 hypothetical protein SERLA73DRAFT_189576 [Serpula lacrymans var. lacrymans S7.3]EGO18745.1 hypothetical protein SERLADRAFT_480434 [Serpula lacrymans var. lacrymans S7.9]
MRFIPYQILMRLEFESVQRQLRMQQVINASSKHTFRKHTIETCLSTRHRVTTKTQSECWTNNIGSTEGTLNQERLTREHILSESPPFFRLSLVV